MTPRGKLPRTNGQSTLEYAVLIAVVAAAAIGMQIYVKRGLQGRLRQSADSIGEQYAPGRTISTFTTNVTANRTEAVEERGRAATTNIAETTTRTGSETVQESYKGAKLFHDGE